MQSSFRQPRAQEEGSITIATHLKIPLVNVPTFLSSPSTQEAFCSFLKEFAIVVVVAAVAALPPRSALIADNPGLEISRIRESL